VRQDAKKDAGKNGNGACVDQVLDGVGHDVTASVTKVALVPM
jgi:hypothetical protein